MLSGIFIHDVLEYPTEYLFQYLHFKASIQNALNRYISAVYFFFTLNLRKLNTDQRLFTGNANKNHVLAKLLFPSRG